ncbi:MAG: Ig-like domain-containing protein [Terriglobia bacterium]
MRLQRVSLGIAGFALLAGVLLYHPRHVTRAQSSQPAAGCCGGPSIAPRELDFPYYTLLSGFRSTLYLVSDSPIPIDLSIVLYGIDGEAQIAPPYTIQPEQKLAIDLHSLVTRMKLDPTGEFAQGSIAVYYEGTIMPVVGQVSIQNPTLGLAHEAEMVENDPGRSDIPPVLDGLWWGIGGGRQAQVTVANMADEPQIADLYLDFGGARHVLPPLVFTPHGLQVLSIPALLGQLGVSPAQAPEGGISIVPHGPKSRLIAQGKIWDPVTGFSTTLRFPGSDTQPSSALHASGFPIGVPAKGSPYAGMGNFTPHLALRNLLQTPQQVTVTLEYPVPSSAPPPVYSSGTVVKNSSPVDLMQSGDPSITTQQNTVTTLTVPALSAVDLSLLSVMGSLPLPLPYASLRVQYSGSPGSMVAELASVDQRQNLVIDSKLINEGWRFSGSGANPWHLDNQTQSFLFLTNESSQTVPIGFVVTANSVHYYLTKLRLRPHETRVIDLRKLRDARQADFKGNTIPSAATDGGVNWLRIGNAPVMGRVVVIERHKGMASNYDCGPCGCDQTLSGFSITPPPPSCVGPHTLTALCCMANLTDCNNNVYPTDITPECTWTSSNTSVARMDGTTRGQVDGVAAGSTEIQAAYSGYNYYWDSYYCASTPVNGDGYAAMHVVNSGCPDHTQIASDRDVGQICSPSGILNAYRLVTYSVLDANGSPVGSISNPLFIYEGLAFVSRNNCGNPNPSPENFGVIAGSQFTDGLHVNCPPNPAQDCGFTINATWISSPLFQFAPVIIMTLDGEVVHTGYTTVLAVRLLPRTTDTVLPGTCVYANGSETLPGTAGCPRL